MEPWQPSTPRSRPRLGVEREYLRDSHIGHRGSLCDRSVRYCAVAVDRFEALTEPCCTRCRNPATGFFNRSVQFSDTQRVYYCAQTECQIAALAVLSNATMNELPKRGDGAVA